MIYLELFACIFASNPYNNNCQAAMERPGKPGDKAMTSKSELILLHKKSYREFSDYIANNSQKQPNGQIALIVDDKSIKAWGAGVLEQKVIRYMNS